MSRSPSPQTDYSGTGGGDTTHFGFQTVPEAAKAGRVRDVFDSVAGRYDLMNDLMSGGLHRLWKRSMIDSVNPRPGQHLLDVAGGTGDIAFRLLAAAGSHAHVTVCDVNAAMLEVGRRRAARRRLADRMDWLCGDAETLPLPDRCVDAYTIAFGIRNVTRPERALAEARRVLKPGGRFVCLEFSHPSLPLLDRLYDTYSFEVIPRLGGWVAGDAASYRYLVESIRRFPDADRFAAMMAQAGLSRVRHRTMSGGIVALHGAWRL